MENLLTIDQQQKFWASLDLMEKTSKKVDKLYMAVVGDDEMKTEGIISRLERVEKKLEETDRLIAKTKGWIAGAAAVGSVVGFIAGNILKLIIK